MILQALTDYYELLAGQGKISPPGWASVKISWGLEIDESGQLTDVLPLRHPSENGKKEIPVNKELPAPVKRSSGILSNFLWDNSSYMLGVDLKGNPERASECFVAARKLHLRLLESAVSPCAKALISFFNTWKPECAQNNPVYNRYQQDLLSGDNMTFYFRGRMVTEEPEIKAIWMNSYGNENSGQQMRCLVTGQNAVPEMVHPAIKNVRDAQSSGAALVSFNAPAFCSFGREQNANAPISKHAAFAYTSALNYLLADRNHVKLIGNTTVVYWANDGEEQYRDAFSALLEGNSDRVSDEDLESLMDSVSSGNLYNYDGLPLNPANEFYILGLSPNAARLSVRFFWHSHFGTIISKLKKHYSDIDVVSNNHDKWLHMPLWALLRETVNQKSSDKSPLPQLAGDVMRSMISGGRYPETLINQTLIRIRTEHNITRGRAGIVKAYLIRNTDSNQNDQYREVTMVSLNEDSGYTPYVLGRLFAVLEAVQQGANPGINATIKDRFFNSACATPAAVFPILLKLSNSHLKKMENGKAVFWSKQIGDLTDRLGIQFPTHLSLQDQGTFILGYYHQTQKRYEKKNKEMEAK